MTRTSWVILVVVLLIISGVAFVNKEKVYENVSSYLDTTFPITESTPLPFGRVTLRVGQTANFQGVSVKLLRVFDDSRCATGVTCIWAGTVKVEIRTVSGMGTSTDTIELGKTLTTEAEKITFIEASPYPKANESISSEDYKVTLEVGRRTDMPANGKESATGACYVGGCSGEVCSGQEGIASNCIYRPEFACYKKAKCERQLNGQCGWTQNSDLQICLTNSERK